MQPRIYVHRGLHNPRFAGAERDAVLAELATLGAVEDEPGELTAEHADGVVASIASSSPYRDSFYEAAGELRVVARWGVGFDQVNVPAATRHGVLITLTPVHMDTVAEYTVAQWLATLKRVYTLNRMSHTGEFDVIRTYEAQGSTLGLYGFGRIGQEVAKRARPLLGPTGRLLVYDVRKDLGTVAASFDAEAVDDPAMLFRECDTVSLHVSGDAQIVGAEQLALMQPHASLINPSRGNLVDDAAANRAVSEERLFYYVVDDPVNGPRAIHKDHPRIICTNHNAGITVESAARLDRMACEQVRAAIEGRIPPHVLNTEALEHPRVRAWARSG